MKRRVFTSSASRLAFFNACFMEMSTDAKRINQLLLKMLSARVQGSLVHDLSLSFCLPSKAWSPRIRGAGLRGYRGFIPFLMNIAHNRMGEAKNCFDETGSSGLFMNL
jgi:hypothetical protein